MARIILERTYSTPLVSNEAWFESDSQLGVCLEERGVEWLRSTMSSDRRRTICEFQAADAETVRESCRRAGIPFERVYAAEVIEP
ncbi:MAG: nickel-binding protein [Elainellaceae cyanobacterium]